jgi:hypothetical protein
MWPWRYTARFSVIDPHRMMQTCALTDGFVRKGIITLTYGQVSVNATRCRIGERRRPILRPEILALQRPAAGGAVLYLLGISLASLGVVKEDPSVMPFGVPELCPQFVRPSARAIQRGHRLTSSIGTS